MKNLKLVSLLLIAAALCLISQPQRLSEGVAEPIKPTDINARQKVQADPLTTSQTAAAGASRPIIANKDMTASGSRPEQSLKLARQTNNQAVTADGRSFPIYNYKALALPNDPNAAQPWVAAANIGAAWDTPAGSSPTLLAVIDTGFGLMHEEFANRWVANSGEQGVAAVEAASQLNCTARSLAVDESCNVIDDDHDGVVDNESGATTEQNASRLNCSDQARPLSKDCNNIDDDGNGLADDLTGWDFANFDDNVQAGEVNPNGSGVHHGTYVTGVAAATGNNAKGIAGVNWTTKVLPIQALDDSGSGDTIAVANAIRYATSRGADVISLSLGGEFSDPVVREAVQAAIAAGAVVVAAAGNDGCDCISYPANYPEVVAVGATRADGQRASFSSYGANLDIMAPGTGLYTSDWRPDNQVSAYAGGIAGTSLSTPIISGLLARLLSLQPESSPMQLIAALSENTNRAGLAATLPRSNTLGFGLVDGGRASVRLTTPYAPLQLYSFNPVSKGRSLISATPFEVESSSLLYKCPSLAYGSTPIYELIKSGQLVFSASTVETQQAIQRGYAAYMFSYACLTQPHDAPVSTIRSISLHKEFRNLTDKW